MTLISKRKLLKAIECIFGDLSSDLGAYARTDHGYEWMSTARIVEIINEQDEYERDEYEEDEYEEDDFYD